MTRGITAVEKVLDKYKKNGRYYVITSYRPSDDDWRYRFGYFTISEELFDKVIVDNFLWFRHTLDSVIIEIVDCF